MSPSTLRRVCPGPTLCSLRAATCCLQHMQPHEPQCSVASNAGAPCRQPFARVRSTGSRACWPGCQQVLLCPQHHAPFHCPCVCEASIDIDTDIKQPPVMHKHSQACLPAIAYLIVQVLLLP